VGPFYTPISRCLSVSPAAALKQDVSTAFVVNGKDAVRDDDFVPADLNLMVADWFTEIVIQQ